MALKPLKGGMGAPPQGSDPPGGMAGEAPPRLSIVGASMRAASPGRGHGHLWVTRPGARRMGKVTLFLLAHACLQSVLSFPLHYTR